MTRSRVIQRKNVRGLRPIAVGFAAIAMLLFLTPIASALIVDVDGTVITDGGLYDLDTLINGEIVFDSVFSGFPTFSQFDAKGFVEIVSGAGSHLNIGTANYARLTDLIVDAPNSASVPNQFRIVFEHNFGPATAGPANAADQIDDAFSNDGTTAAPFVNNSGAVPLAANEDFMFSWQGFIDNVAIPNPSGTPPFGNLAGLNQAYPVYGHAEPLMFGGLVYTPTLRGELTIELGGPRNQFILLNSAEVGIGFVPEPSTYVLAVLGLLGLGLFHARRKRVRRL